ncbi:universal stress protein [Nocardia barduliensis]|uniref:universal stress protein n=1 Tax=Nocardia barduliensis TaxID=2736643 RepID=UPI001573FD72|nr:universal stress protein [Nocardia barduliensis]
MVDQHEDNPHELASAAVVVGTDGTEHASAAVRWAARTASDRGRRLLIVHGMNLPAARATLGVYDVMVPAVSETMRARGSEILAEARALAHDVAPDLAVATKLGEENAAALLITLSAHTHLVVLGATPGMGTIAHLGSTLLAVTAHADGAVVVVRGDRQLTGDRAPVVVGADGSEVGEAAIAAAFAEAAARDVDLVTIHAWSDLSAGEFAGTRYLEIPLENLAIGERALLAERLAGWQEKYPDVTVIRRVYLSGPRKHLGDWSRNAQLVVVGSRGRGGFRGLLLGSTSNWLVQHAECPVMVVHPK